MARQEKVEAVQQVANLEALAVKLEALQQEAAALGEERVAKQIGYSIKSARWADKQRAGRIKRVGGLVEQMKAKGLSDAEIVARLTGGQG